jgi:type I site-specific restriction endonuclease
MLNSPSNLIVYGENPMNMGNGSGETTAELIQKIRNLNIPRHHFIDERDITEYFNRHFRHLVPEDFKTMLTNYYYKKEEEIDEIQNTQALLDISQKYMQNLENQVRHVFSSFRTSIADTKRMIQRTIRQRGDFILNLERDGQIDTKNEVACLKTMKRLHVPDDIIRYISSYAYTPLLKYTLTKSMAGDVSTRLDAMRATNLKKFSRNIQLHACAIYNYLCKHILPNGSIRQKCNVSILAGKKIRNNNKNNIIEDILSVLNCCHGIIENFIHRKTFPKTLHWLLLKMRHIYLCILYVSRPEFNGRRTRK